jgi:hypothetical protein
MRSRSIRIPLCLLAIRAIAGHCLQAQSPPPKTAAAIQRQNEGLYNEMVERHKAWRTAHDEFDASISNLIKRAALAKPADRGPVLVDLCSPVLRSHLNSALDLLHQQLEAQSRYFNREKDDAARALKEENNVLIGRRESDSQRQRDLENAEKELQFMRDQYKETAATREGAANNPTRLDYLNRAIEELDMAIKAREDKVKDLKGAADLNTITIEALDETRFRIENRVRQNQDNVSVIEARKVYFEAYYSMRGAQIRQYCVDTHVDVVLK